MYECCPSSLLQHMQCECHKESGALGSLPCGRLPDQGCAGCAPAGLAALDAGACWLHLMLVRDAGAWRRPLLGISCRCRVTPIRAGAGWLHSMQVHGASYTLTGLPSLDAGGGCPRAP
eukprot:scaffold36126_cov17-Tisochrysis_lutea.AAC.1